MITDWQKLVTALRKEVEEYGGLLNLFDQQQAAILRRDADGVLTAVGAIETQIKTIDFCRKEREAIAHAFSTAFKVGTELPLRDLVEKFPEPVQLLLNALIDEVNSLIIRSKRRAQQNQLLLSRSIEITQQILQRLNPAGTAKTYSANGRVKVALPENEARCIAKS